MQVFRSKSFLIDLQNILDYISKDSPRNAMTFYNRLNKKIDGLSFMPKKYRKSIYFDDESIRDLIFKGYVVPYKIFSNKVVVLGITKYKKGF